MAFKVPDIPGAEDVVRWFGQWPSFHDAEVISIPLHRSKGVIVEIHAFETSSEVDTRGYYVQAKHAIITFALDGFPMNAEGIASTRIEYFNHQNVLSGVDIERAPGGYILTLDGCFGVDAVFYCERLMAKIQPGIPDDSIYGRSAG